MQGMVRASNEDLGYYLKIFRELIAACDLEFPETIATTQTIFTDFTKTITSSPIAKLRYMMTSLVTPAMEAAVTAAARAHATNEATDVAIAIELFRRREGKLPEKLDELVPDFLPEVAVDPFDGKPLRYLVEGPDQYAVYSIGPNAKDDQGQDDHMEGDLVVRIYPMSSDDSTGSAEDEQKPAAESQVEPETP